MVTLNKLTDIQITSCDNHQFSVYYYPACLYLQGTKQHC